MSNTMERVTIHQRQNISPALLKKVIEERINSITPAIKPTYAVTSVNAKNMQSHRLTQRTKTIGSLFFNLKALLALLLGLLAMFSAAAESMGNGKI